MSMKKIKATMKEIYDAMRPNVYRNRKKYTRKTKHKIKKHERFYLSRFRNLWGAFTPPFT